MGRESPNFMHGDHLPGMMPDLGAMMAGHLPGMPYATDPLWAARMQNITGLNPMMAFQPNGLGHFASKLPFSAGIPLPGYIHGLHAGLGAFLPSTGVSAAAAMAASSTPLNLTPSSRFNNESPAFDVRKSSIEALRLKAKEHSANVENRLNSNVTVKSESALS